MSEQQLLDSNARIQLEKRPSGNEVASCFQLRFCAPPSVELLSEGKLILRTLFVSVDASNRFWLTGAKSYTDGVNPGDVMKAGCVSEVLLSKSSKFKVGDLAVGILPLQKYNLAAEKEVVKVPRIANPQHYLGLLGISGLTAYIGLEYIGNANSGDKVLVSSASGAVGSLVVQLALLKGCQVFGIVGSIQKQESLSKFGVKSINYKTAPNLSKAIKQLCPKGVDVYFDNVGGTMLDAAIDSLRPGGRVVLCGAISQYGEAHETVRNIPKLIIKKASMQGFIYYQHPKAGKAAKQLARLVIEGKISLAYKQYQGIQSYGRALQDLLTGRNEGKVVLRVALPQSQATF